ncbi:MAG: pyruvate:ferredoxin (flavodoxin) oxidoreductase, partial [Eggerthellaceae bacterium]|nr:pyruvate:ferredoxin (flavodoxin) oxidoreductase [Eggerthellaceae bacterium]
DYVDQWAANGRKNIFGSTVHVCEMQSEAGAAGTVHGSLASGAMTTTYTASQGLLLMIPNMFKIAGELLPSVFHVSARCVSSHALNIFGDHSDVMACRQTGFAMLAENNVQEVMDLSAVAHLAAIKGRVPFINFFDGFRTSHEIQKIAVWEYDELAEMVDWEAVDAFRNHSLNPNRPSTRGSHENDDIFFQHREACNKYYEELPAVVEQYMDKINAKLGTDYKLFNYYGAEDADRVIVAMGSLCDVAEEVINYLMKQGEKVGLIKVRLYRPFVTSMFVDALPRTIKKIAVLDRTKEPGAIGEPLYLDVIGALKEEGLQDLEVIGGRYGLGSKDTPPASIFAIFKELAKDNPKQEFSIGIVDDLSNLSLEEEEVPITAAEGAIECKFWGLGGDGTVGANKNSIKIIGDHTDNYVQAYFQYDSKKTGGVTVSHLRVSKSSIKRPYYVNKADFVACHNPSYITKGFPIAQDVKPGGTLLINWQLDADELENHLDGDSKKFIADNDIKVYLINAINLAVEIGMGKRTNTILQSAFFALANILPLDEAIKYMEDAATKSYSKKGEKIVDMNHKAINVGATAYKQFEVPASWGSASGKVPYKKFEGRSELVKMVENITNNIGRMDGYSIPVSVFADHVDGQFEQGASASEKRGIAVTVPVWHEEKCIMCNKCSYVCPHACIRPYALTDEEVASGPDNLRAVEMKGKGKGEYKYTLAVSPLDCMACTLCARACSTGALTMTDAASQLEEQKVFDYCVAKITGKPDLQSVNVRGSQFMMPYLEFSGSCAGCAETSYARLITQLFGDRMFVSNATGCSSIWGGPAAVSPYTCNKDGKGVAWSNSLFEDNAEHGLGMYIGHEAVRKRCIESAKQIKECGCAEAAVIEAIDIWLDTLNDGTANAKATEELIPILKENKEKEEAAGKDPIYMRRMLENQAYLSKKSFWIFGGDGWAYDIGYGGLDHVIASGEDVNIFVFDTEVYSNTGGQASKASNIGQVAQFAAAGKDIKKKSLSELAMQYGYVYVAQVAMGANNAQTLKAIVEAEAYNGPSLIIAYSPCEMHAIKGGMVNCQDEMKLAVKCGYWNLFRFNPDEEVGKKFTLDSKEPEGGYREFLMNEARYARLTREFPDRAKKLFAKNEAEASKRYEHLVALKDLYANV